MTTKKIAWTVAALAVAQITVAGPQVVPGSVTFDQDPATRKVTVGYQLAGDESAIVTIDIQTNAEADVWVSIGGENLSRFAGDVNKAMPANASGTATWQADAAWPGHLVPGGVRAVVTAWATNAPPDYLAADLAARTRRYYATAAEVPGGVTNAMYKTTVLLMRRIPAAEVEWRMGAGSADECGAGDFAQSEYPHRVKLSSDYYIGIYPVTQRQYLLIHENGKASYSDVPGGKSPSGYTSEDADIRPVVNVAYTYVRGGSSWPGQRSIASGDMGRMAGRARAITGLEIDLPTEAQWEYAARAGNGYAYVDGTSVWKDSLGWTSSNAGATSVSRAVGQGPANAWGLYDLHGNVWEICLDMYNVDYYGVSPMQDPPGADSSSFETVYRTTRGGGCSSPSSSARFSKRGYIGTTSTATATGFRFVCPAVVPGE